MRKLFPAFDPKRKIIAFDRDGTLYNTSMVNGLTPGDPGYAEAAYTRFDGDLYEGVPEMLLELKAQGHHLALITSGSQGSADRFVDCKGLRHIFGKQVFGRSNRTKAEQLDVLCFQEEVDRRDALLVDDAPGYIEEMFEYARFSEIPGPVNLIVPVWKRSVAATGKDLTALAEQEAFFSFNTCVSEAAKEGTDLESRGLNMAIVRRPRDIVTALSRFESCQKERIANMSFAIR